jgi:predicted MPP superfamily phosphohydrolase
MQQLFPYWYRISCVVMFLGNSMLPMQFLFSNNLLDPQTGDPYQFNMICALCYGFVFTMIGLNILLDASIFIAQKIFGWTTLYQQLRLVLLRRRFHRAPLTFLLSAKIVLGGALIAKEDPIVVQITVPISHLPESLENFRIIQLSDVHIGVTIGRTRVKKVVDIVNDLCSGSADDKCDLIALTGDIIDCEPYGVMKAIEPLDTICPNENVSKVFVPGNHEHIHFNVDHVVSVLSKMGIDSLLNDHIRLPRDEARENQLVVVGLDDLSSRRYRGKEQQAFDGIDSEKDTIISLAHQPNHLRKIERYGVDLMLSGHTHAGQFFPGTVGAWLFNSRFSGYYPPRGNKTAVYVSAGTLWWGPPIRFSTRHHEITDIRLVRSQ